MGSLDAVEGHIGFYSKWLIVGSGPSAANVDLISARAAGVGIMFVNGSYRLLNQQGVVGDVLVMSDPNAMREYGEEAARCAKVACFSAAASGFSGVNPSNAVYFQQWSKPGMDDGNVEVCLDRPLYHSGSVAHAALQIALGLGAQSIAFVGVDLSDTVENPYAFTTPPAENNRFATVFQKNRGRILAGFVAARNTLSERMPQVGIYHIKVGGVVSHNPFPAISWSDYIGCVGRRND